MLLDQSPVPLFQVLEARKQLAEPSTGSDHVAKNGGRVLAHLERLPTGQDDREPIDVIGRLAGIKAVGATRVIADHAAQGAPGVGGRVRAESEAMALGFPAQVVEDNPRLHPGHAASRVDLEHPGHVPRHVHDDRFIAGLAGEAGACAARQKSSAGVRCQPGRRLHVGLVDREDHAEGDLPVIGRVAGVGRPRGGIEADFASENIGQRPPEGVPLRFS